MESRLTHLKYKEVIDVTSGSRYGYVGDVEVDWGEGKVLSLVLPGKPRLFGLLGREEDVVVPFSAVRRFGEDIILVEGDWSGPKRLDREGTHRAKRKNRGETL